MSSFKDHCPDPEKISAGVKMPLFDVDGGISKDYLMIRWRWDDKVRAALDNVQREGRKRLVPIRPDMDAKAKKEAESSNEAVTQQLVLEGVVSQVSGWSFTEKATTKNLVEFLRARPDVAERIDVIAANTKLFFTDSGKSS